MMKKCLEENVESLIGIKKPNVSEEQIVAHWNLVLAKIKPVVKDEKQDDRFLKKDEH